jgi:hypothetical protein
MTRPVEFTLEEQARRAISPVLIAIGLGLWAVPMLVDAIRTGATSVTVSGGRLHLSDALTFVGIAMTILGGILLVSGKPPAAATERFERNSSLSVRGKSSSARISEIHSKTKLFGPWIEMYATLDVLEPPYTVKTTVVVNRDSLRSFRPGETVVIRIDPDNRDEIALGF